MQPVIRYTLLEEAIVENLFENGGEINKETVYLMKEANLNLTSGNPYCVMVMAHSSTKVTSEAMAILATKEFQQVTFAKALVVRTFLQKMVGNFYLNIKNPATPTKIFTERDKAIEWLRNKKAKRLL